MTTKTASTKPTITVTAIARLHGDIEVHKQGCRDLERDAVGASIWNIKVTRGMRDVVLGVYPPDEFEYDPKTWAEYTEGFRVLPCCPSLDGRKTKRNAAWARQYRASRRAVAA